MAASDAEIRAGLEANLRAIADVQVNPYWLSSPTSPALQILGGRQEYDKAMSRGLDVRYYTVQAYVALTTDIGAQKLLGQLRDPAGPTSVKEAVESDPTLGGIVGGVQVTELGPERPVLTEGRQGLASEWTVKVTASGV